MNSPTGRLLKLVSELDGLGPAPTLVALAGALEAAQLTLADVASYVERNPRNYNRALVAIRSHYELLVMTWLPGQSSVPHDHAGSICAMQVLAGDAVEGSYRVADDGYVDFEYETVVKCGEITAGQDAGIHTVLNPSDAADVLVTVHAYAPPLKDFRRFVPRPAAPVAATASEPTPALPTVVVVGGGFSGAMTAAQLLRKAKSAGIKLRVIVVERRGAVGEGVAYGTRELAHLLNVPAGKMSAWPDRPDDFLHWAAARDPRAKAGDFLPRQWYGEYVRETLLHTGAEVGAAGELSVLFDEVRRVARRPDGGWLVHLGRGASVKADAIVLAVGHRPPDDPFGSRWSGPRTRLIADPWRAFAMNVVRPEESVIIVGTGLTASDAVLSLQHPQRTGAITIVSRRGLLPQAHAQTPMNPVDLKPLVAELLARPNGVRALELSRRVRRAVKEAAAKGVDWRAVVDGLRPHTANLWKAMPMSERRRFLCHLRPFWEVHRHRMALAIAERFGDMRDYDQVASVAGRIVSVVGSEERVQMVVAGRGENGRLTLEADWVVNCTGPAPSNCAAANPAIGSLLVDGWLKPDELGLGLDTASEGNAIDRHGNEVPDLLIVGTLRKPALWESTAVPELRGQAAVAAERLVQLLWRRSLATPAK